MKAVGVNKNNVKYVILLLVILIFSSVFIPGCIVLEHFYGIILISRFLPSDIRAILMCSGILLNIAIISYILKIIISLRILNHGEAKCIDSNSKVEDVTSLRAQKHDFVNHLQVIYGLVQLKNQEKIRDYIKSTMNDLKANGDPNEFQESPIISALFVGKFSHGKSTGIKLSCNLKVDLNDIKVDQYKTSRILANMLDNAMDAAGNTPNKNKYVDVKIYRDENTLYLEVANSGPPVRRKDINKIFQPGYTTKKGKGQGLGLYIVKQLIQELSGEIKVRSKEGKGQGKDAYRETTFVVGIPLIEDESEDESEDLSNSS